MKRQREGEEMKRQSRTDERRDNGNISSLITFELRISRKSKRKTEEGRIGKENERDEQGGYHLEIIHHVAGGSLGAFLLIGLIIGLYAFRHYWRKYKAQIIQRAVNEANVNNIEQFQLA